ncbi:MAG: glycosyltransferase [Pseudomonadota bacterium]
MAQKLVIAVCTAQRPNMLKACLDSLDKQVRPKETDLSVVVVENDAVPFFTGEAEADAKAAFAIPVFFHHEPRRGIPFARNTALEAALAHDPDWIALIDDDERAEPDWIGKLLGACKTFEAEVANGPVRRIYEKPAPHWWKSQLLKPRPTGTEITEAPTNNVLISARIVRQDGLGLRFDERLTFGSEDIDFFRRTHAAGAKMIWVDDAFVEEDQVAIRDRDPEPIFIDLHQHRIVGHASRALDGRDVETLIILHAAEIAGRRHLNQLRRIRAYNLYLPLAADIPDLHGGFQVVIFFLHRREAGRH